MLLLIVAINVDKLESKALLHYVKYCPHMNSKFDYGKIDSILMTSLRYTYSVYMQRLFGTCCRKHAISCGQHAGDNKLLSNVKLDAFGYLGNIGL